MAGADFITLIDRVLGHEGGYVNDPQDPGGETRWGISKRAYPHEDIAHLSRDMAIELYRRDYWLTIRGPELPRAIAFQVLDTAVNHGPETAIRLLQGAAGAEQDGVIGPNTMLALSSMPPLELLARFNSARIYFYTELKKWPRFGRGWAQRVAENLVYGVRDAA